MNDAIAHFYAGVPEDHHVQTIVSELDGFPRNMQYTYVSAILSSPPTASRDQLRTRFLSSDDLFIRRLVVQSMVERGESLFSEILYDTLHADPDPLVRAGILQILSTERPLGTADIIANHLQDPDPMVRITAAGQILRLVGAPK